MNIFKEIKRKHLILKGMKDKNSDVSIFKTLIFCAKANLWDEEMTMIRKKPLIYKNGVNDYSYCTDFLKFEGVNKKGEILYKHLESNKHIFGKNMYSLDAEWNDGKWISENIMRTVNHNFDKFLGKKSYRISKTKTGDGSWMSSDDTLVIISAFKNHLVVEVKSIFGGTYQTILDNRWANVNDWKIAA